MSDRKLRIVQWTTGKVARESVKAMLQRPNLELVGVYAYSKEKVGQDAGDLCNLGRKLGLKATDDIDALIALKPDCVVYMPLHPNVEHMCQLLRGGVNIATTASFITGRGYGEAARKKLEEAAQAGKASLFGSGINPGWVDAMTSVASGLCREVHMLRITESFNIGLWAGDANQDELGWNRPKGDPGHAKDVEKATLPFGDAVEAVAEMFHFKLDEIRCEAEFAHATQDLDIPGRPVKKGNVAGILARWQGIAGGHPVIELNALWTLSADIEPNWEIAMAYQIEILGMPEVKMRVEVLPDLTLPMEQLMTVGMMLPAIPVINAIPAVVDARPGIVTYADLKPVASVFAPKALPKWSPSVSAAKPAETHAPKSSGAASVVEGKWNVTVKGPTGAQATELLIERVDGKLSGTQSGQGQSSPLVEISVDGNKIRWVNQVQKPIKMKVEFNGTIEGATMSGKCKAGFMGSYPFTGNKV